MLDVHTVYEDRQLRALTGLDLGAFAALLAPFACSYQALAEARFPLQQRQRRAGGGRKSRLGSLEQKLFFLLVYLKTYPTFDVLGATFGLHRSKAHLQIQHLAQVLLHTLQQAGVLPARQIGSLAEMKRVFADVPTLLVDATERPIQRPAAAVDRPASYSGKKNDSPSKTPSSVTRDAISTT